MLLAILGKTPKLSLAELISLYGQSVRPFSELAALIDRTDLDFDRLGGTIKVAEVIGELPSTDWSKITTYLASRARRFLSTEGKQTLGISVYNQSLSAGIVRRSALSLKSELKRQGYSIRIVPNQAAALNSAQVLHNKLVEKGAEIIIVSEQARTIIGRTVHVQDIEAYSERDYGRPKRDSKVGMLPPKLAQIMINLAVGPMTFRTHSSDKLSRESDLSAGQGADEERTEAYKSTLKEHRKQATTHSAKSLTAQRVMRAGRSSDLTILDPFCGTGVVLQEAMLSGFQVYGSDISQRMINYSTQNLEWLKHTHKLNQSIYQLTVADATEHTWDQPIDAVVSELYLGELLKSQPTPDQLAKLQVSSRKLIAGFLKNLSNQLTPGTPVVLAIPIWRAGGRLTAPQFDQMSRFGYNRKSFAPAGSDEMIYIRPQQFTGREIIVLERV